MMPWPAAQPAVVPAAAAPIGREGGLGGGKEGGGVDGTPPPPMVPMVFRKVSFKLKSSCAEGAEEHFEPVSLKQQKRRRVGMGVWYGMVCPAVSGRRIACPSRSPLRARGRGSSRHRHRAGWCTQGGGGGGGQLRLPPLAHPSPFLWCSRPSRR